MKRYIEGIKFGMVLQLAIGPMCLLVFNTSRNVGFVKGLIMVFVIASVDLFYITLSCVGVSKLLEKSKFKVLFKVISSVILMLFGFSIILGSFGINVLPILSINPSSKNIFLQGLVLALSNPITIIYWGSILTNKLLEDNFKKRELIVFCMGLVSSTLIFLSFISFVGSVIGNFIPLFVANILNVIVGIVIIYFGVNYLIKNKY
ncbi:MAG: LysE family transporter [Bacilli bacterium]|nr:LysE family transporter [Bacilli bacterium]